MFLGTRFLNFSVSQVHSKVTVAPLHICTSLSYQLDRNVGTGSGAITTLEALFIDLIGFVDSLLDCRNKWRGFWNRRLILNGQLNSLICYSVDARI